MVSTNRNSEPSQKSSFDFFEFDSVMSEKNWKKGHFVVCCKSDDCIRAGREIWKLHIQSTGKMVIEKFKQTMHVH